MLQVPMATSVNPWQTARLDLSQEGVRPYSVVSVRRISTMKRMAVVAAVLFAGSITLSSAALWAQDTGDQDAARPDTGEVGVDDGGRQLRESQHPEPGFGNDPLNQQRTPDSS